MVTLWTCDERAVHLRWGPPKISDFWGEQRPWSPADLIRVPRELRSNGERRSDGALYFGMPKSFSEVRDDEGYRLCDPSAECECKITAFFWHGNGLSRMLCSLCLLTCTMLRRHNPFYGLSPLSLPFYGCLWKSVPRVCKQPEREEIYIFEKRKLFTFYMYSFLDL